MKFAEFCNTSASYIGHIETGKKFPSMDMIEKMAIILRIKPYHFFIDRTENGIYSNIEQPYPKLPESMKKEIKTKIDLSMDTIINEILMNY